MHGQVAAVDDDAQREALALALSFAVPLWLERVRALTPEERQQRAVACGRIVSLGATVTDWSRCNAEWGESGPPPPSQGDVGPALLAVGERPRGKNVGKVAAVFDALAEGLALLALENGGVTFLGRHWEAGRAVDVRAVSAALAAAQTRPPR